MNVFELFAKLALDTSEYDKGLDDAEKDAQGFGSKLKSGLGKATQAVGTAAKVGAAAVAGVAAAAVGAGTAIYKATGEVAAYGDEIDKMSQKMGISAEAYQEWDAVMQHSGTSMESLKSSMKTMASAAEKGNEAFEKLGISEEEVANLSQEDLFDRVISGLQNMEEGTERTYIASQLLGRGATELGALLNTSAEETQAMKDRVHELGGVMSDEAVKAAAAYQDTLQDLQTGFEGLKRNLLSEFLPGVTTVMAGLTSLTTGDYDLGAEQISEGVDGFIESAMDKIPKFAEVGFKIISAIAGSVTENAPKLLQMGADVVIMLIQGLNGELPTLLPIALNAVLEIITAILNNAPIILENLLVLIQTIADFILNDGLPILVSALPDIIVGIVDFILSGSTMITDAVIQILYAIIELTPEIVTMLAGALPQIISGVIVALMKNAPLLSQAILKLTIASLLIIPAVIAQILMHIPEIFKAIGDGFKEKWPEMKENGMKALMEAVNGMSSDPVMNAIVNAIAKFIVNAINKLKEAAAQFKDAGQYIMDGLIKGIQNKISAVTNVISGVAKGIKKVFTGDLDIHSPSGVFEDYGEDTDKGYAVGITKNLNLVDKAMDAFSDSVTLPKSNVGFGLYGEEESGYNGLIDIIVQALRIVAPELATNVNIDGNKDRIVDITVQANRDYQRMTGASLYGV